MIQCELRKKLKILNIIFWKPESVQENETHKILQGFVLQTDHIILARIPDLVWINTKKRSYYLIDFDLATDHRVRLMAGEILTST